MKKLMVMTCILLLSIAGISQSNTIYATRQGDDPQIRKISANPTSGATSGSFSKVEDIHSSAALGATNNGWLIYLEYGNGGTGEGNGEVDVYAVKADGSTNNPIKIINDANIASGNEELGFVRLGVDKNNVAWIVTKRIYGNDIYAASFQINASSNNISASNFQRRGSFHTSDGANNIFQNGDLAFDGLGAMYILANDGDGKTKIYTVTGATLSNTGENSQTTIEYKWSLKKTNGDNFRGNVNGCAFSSTGSMFLSTSDGLYFIDQSTVHQQGTGTVECDLSKSASDLSDLASPYWPAYTALPVKFGTIEVMKLNKIITKKPL